MYNYLKNPVVAEEVSKNNFGKHVIMFLDKPTSISSKGSQGNGNSSGNNNIFTSQNNNVNNNNN